MTRVCVAFDLDGDTGGRPADHVVSACLGQRGLQVVPLCRVLRLDRSAPLAEAETAA